MMNIVIFDAIKCHKIKRYTVRICTKVEIFLNLLVILATNVLLTQLQKCFKNMQA